MTDSDQAQTRIFLMIVLLAALVRLVFLNSLSGNDDLSVAGCALDLLERGFHLTDSAYCLRYGITLPLAAVFGVAGTGAAQISVVPALASLTGIFLAWRLGRLLFDRWVGLAAAAALAVFPLDIEFAGLAFPDVLQGTLMSGAVLCALLARSRGDLWAVAAGALWAWAYYVKLDAFFLGFVLLLAALLGFITFRHLVITGAVSLLLVGVELATYAMLLGRPLLNLELNSAVSNEVLAPGFDYRSFFIYPKAMFLTPYGTGLHFFVLLGALFVAAWKRSRPALFLAGWVLIWMVWLMFGVNPLGGFTGKAQLSRYLLSFAVPLSVLCGWVLVLLWRRSRLLGAGLAGASLALMVLFGAFNQLSYESAKATRVALETAVRNGWFPLYPDSHSMGIVKFLLHGRPGAADIHRVQTHDYLRGETTFYPIQGPQAYLLINEARSRDQQRSKSVRPIDPASFGLKPTEVLSVDNPMSDYNYAALRLLVGAASLLPDRLAKGINATAIETLRPADARIWRLDTP